MTAFLCSHIIERMRRITLLFLLLAACSPVEESKVNTILSMSSPKSQIALQGKTAEEVRQIMGDPTFVRKEKPNESWVFKAPDCAVFVFFDKNGVSTFTESKGACDKTVTKNLPTLKNDIS